MRSCVIALMPLMVVALQIGAISTALADDVPDLGPALRQLDRAKDCKCVEQSLARKRALRDGYRRLAESYKGMLAELGTGGVAPRWVNPKAMTPQQRSRLVLLNEHFDADEQEMLRTVPDAECGFPPERGIVLITDPLTGSPPSRQVQRELKPLFPFEELYDAVLLHEYHHAAEFTRNNPGHEPGTLPQTRTPHGRALEEAAGYDIEIAALEKLAKKCRRRISFSGVKLVTRVVAAGSGMVTTETISGEVCGDPYQDTWRITVHRRAVAAGRAVIDKTDAPFDNDCAEPGSEKARHYERVIKQSVGGYNGWYCLYAPGPPAKVTIRTPKLESDMAGVVIKYDGGHDHSAAAMESDCK